VHDKVQVQVYTGVVYMKAFIKGVSELPSHSLINSKILRLILKMKIILSKCKKTSLKLTNQITQNLRA